MTTSLRKGILLHPATTIFHGAFGLSFAHGPPNLLLNASPAKRISHSAAHNICQRDSQRSSPRQAADPKFTAQALRLPPPCQEQVQAGPRCCETGGINGVGGEVQIGGEQKYWREQHGKCLKRPTMECRDQSRKEHRREWGFCKCVSLHALAIRRNRGGCDDVELVVMVGGAYDENRGGGKR